MTALTSCYFCGEAVGASLDEHELPAAAPGGDRVRLTLCATCAGKLQQLLGQLGGTATGEESAAPGAADAPGPASGEQSPIFAGDEGAVIDTEDGEATPAAERPAEPTFDADESPAAERAAEQPVEERRATSEPPTDEGGESDTEPEAATAAVGDEDVAADPDDASAERAASPETGSAATDAASAAADAASAAADAASSASDATSSPTDAASSHGDETSRDAPEAEAAADSASATRTEASTADDQSGDVSTRTYNRVVRLLQNREFPVDRTEFETLATSAYDMDAQECAAALEVAIQKGLLDERDGQLHRPN